VKKIAGLIRRFKKKGNVIERMFDSIHRFFSEKKLRRSQASAFEKINHMSPCTRVMHAFAKRYVRRCYEKNLQHLRNAVKHRKIRIAFLSCDVTKWHGAMLYNLFAESDNFEPVVLVSKLLKKRGDDEFYGAVSHFKNAGIRVEEAHSPETDTRISILKFLPDIVFYEQPWSVDEKHRLMIASSRALVCYVPYCCHMMVSEYNYLKKFHRYLWKYFVESDEHVEMCRSRFGADNCVSVGNVHWDRYAVESKPASYFWKDCSSAKKRVVYAPHFSFDASHMTATFHENGRAMLNMASMYPNTTWVIRPHPDFDAHVVDNGIMTPAELAEYYAEWKKYGNVFRGAEYVGLFKSSDCLITDCISFLADYLPTGNPVFHLRNRLQSAEFNDYGKEIIGTYYQIHSPAELEKLFSRVMIEGDDFMGEQRAALMKKFAPTDGKSASMRIFECIASALGIQ
jgi:hypothetical protein